MDGIYICKHSLKPPCNMEDGSWLWNRITSVRIYVLLTPPVLTGILLCAKSEDEGEGLCARWLTLQESVAELDPTFTLLNCSGGTTAVEESQ